MYTLIVTDKSGYKLNISSQDFKALKEVAREYNNKGLDVQITETKVVFQVIKNEIND